MSVHRIPDPARTQERLSNLAAAEAATLREGLPPMDAHARADAMRFARGELTADEAVKAIVDRQRNALGHD